MSNTYSIYLSNQYGSNQTYGFFTQPPEATSGVGSVYSNVWISKNLATDGNYQVNITKTFYAWCGTAQATLAPGVKVSLGNSKAAVLGGDTVPGSTFYMYNNGGEPAFKSTQGATADPGCYEIDSGTDFTPNMNFLMGMAAPDGDGRMVPVASFEAPRNAQVNILPHVDYYISSFGTAQGTAIDWKVQSLKAAHIDFTHNPGLYGAIVTHNSNGAFDIKYTVSRAEHLFMIERLEQVGTPLEQEVKRLSEQLAALLKAVPGLQLGGGKKGYNFYGVIDYSPDATAQQRKAIADQMQDAINQGEYDVTRIVREDEDVKIYFSAEEETLLAQVNSDWGKAYNNLSAALKGVSQSEGCELDNSLTVPVSSLPQGLQKIEQQDSLAVKKLEDDTLTLKKIQALRILEENGITNGKANGKFGILPN